MLVLLHVVYRMLTLSDYIQNQVYRLVSDDEIRLSPPNITFRK